MYNSARRSNRLICLLLVACGCVMDKGVLAFVSLLPVVTTTTPLSPHKPQHYLGPNNDHQSGGTILEATPELIFDGSCCIISDPLPERTTKEAAVAFLMQESTLNLLLSAGGIRPTEAFNPTPDLLQMWDEVVQHFGYERKPTMDDILVAVNTTVQFPGLKLVTISLSGVYALTNPDTGLQEYHSFVVADQSQPQGLPPVVWIYNQLTGNAKREPNKFYPLSGKARSIVSVVEQTTEVEGGASKDDSDEDGENNNRRLAFSFDIDFKITVTFPETLLKILPLSEEKMAESGGQSVQKAISKDVNLALQAAAQAFSATVASPLA